MRIAESDSDGSGRPDPTAQWRSLTEETNATGPLSVAYEGFRQLVTLADRHKKELRVARHEVRTAKVNSFARALDDRLTKLRERDEVEAPWCSLTERMPSPTGPLLAAYDAVNTLQHRVELHRELYAGAEVGLEELKVFKLACEWSSKEIEEAEKETTATYGERLKMKVQHEGKTYST